MGLDLEYINGQTPLEEEEKDELRILTISTRGELDGLEPLDFLIYKAQNIKHIC